jgi:extradiol dioxygenase family protein
MFKKSPVLHSFSVNDISAARRFYGETLGLEVEDALMGNIHLRRRFAGLRVRKRQPRAGHLHDSELHHRRRGVNRRPAQ